MQNIRYNWQRYVIPSNIQPPLTPEGYLDTPYGPYSTLDIKKDIELVSVPCVVLLGEMGIGKSAVMTTLREETERQGIQTLTINLRPYTNEQRLQDDLFRSLHFTDWRSGTDELHIFLDGFDECPTRIPALGTLIADHFGVLSKQDRARLSIRIACRAVEWKASQLEKQLAQLWEDEHPLTYSVTPLREEDVYDTAMHRLSDPVAFMDGIRARSCGPLAARPMTLQLLIGVYEKHGTFPGSQKELFEQACLLLCERQDTSNDHLDGAARLQIASRIACVMLLTNAATIIDHPSTYNSVYGEIPIQQLTGDGEHVARQTLSITRDKIIETLNTGLFVPSDASHFIWFHRSVTEYLSARYLANSALSFQQIMQLLQHPADPACKIVPHFHAVAAWYTSFERQAFHHLLESDPDVLLDADLSVASPEERAHLVDALIMTSSEMRWQRLNATTIFRSLTHPRLAEQLGSIISDSGLLRDARWLAVDIATATDFVPEIEATLLPVILDPDQDMTLRVHCAYALAFHGTNDAKRQLVPLALAPNDQDRQDNLKGCALRATWPLALSARQLFEALTPVKAPNLLGAYSFFLDQLAEDLRLADQDVVLALHWAMSNRTYRFSELIEAIKRRAWTVIEQPSVAEAYAQLAVQEIHLISHLEHGSDDEQFALIASKREGRRAVTQHLVQLLRNVPSEITWIIYGRPSLLDMDDFEWLLDCLAEGDSRDGDSWIILIRQMTYFGPTAMIETIFERCETIPVLRELFPFYTDLTTPKAKQERADWYHSEKMRKELEQRLAEQDRLKPNVARGITTLLSRIEEGENERYWSLDSLLATTDGNSRTLECDLRRFSPWSESDESTRSRILDAAYEYILSCNDYATEGWLGTNTVDWRAIAGFRAFDLNPELVHPMR